MKYLAQLNIAKLKKPIDHPSIAGFVKKLDEINALADQSQGFVWRLIEEGESSAVNISIFDDPMLIVNMSVWESIEDLKHFVYHTSHVKVYLQKEDWFHNMESHHMVLWWINKGEIPSPIEAKKRLKYLEETGPSQHAFNFKFPYKPEEK